jgi:hypothetical protein
MPRQSISVGDLLGAKAFKAALETTDTNFQELYNAPTVEYVDTVADFPLAIAGRLIQTKGLNSAGDGGGRLYQNDPANTDAVDGTTVVDSSATLPGANTDDIEVPSSWETGGLPFDVAPVTITDNESQSRDVVEFTRPNETAIAYTYYIKDDRSEVGYAFSAEFWIAPTGDNRVSVSLYSGSAHRTTSVVVLSGSASASIGSGIANITGVAAGFHKVKVSTTYSDVDRILVYPFDASSGEAGPLSNHLYGFEFKFGKWVEVPVSTGEAGSVSASLVDTTSDLPYSADGSVYQTKGRAAVNDGGAKLFVADSTSTLSVDGVDVVAVSSLPNGNTDDINDAASWSSNGTTISCEVEPITDHLGNAVNAVKWTRLTEAASGSSYYFLADQSETGLDETVVEFWIKGVATTNRATVSLYSSGHAATSVSVLSGTASASITGTGLAEITGITSGFHKIRVASTDSNVNRMIVYPYDGSSGETGDLNNIFYDITPVFGKYVSEDVGKASSLVANSDDGVGSTVLPQHTTVEVTSVDVNSDDWISLPSVEHPHEVTVFCNAGSDFKIKAFGSETINGSADPLVATDGTTITLRKATSDNWVAVYTTSAGRVGDAVEIPPAPLLVDTSTDLGSGVEGQIKQTKGLVSVGDGGADTYVYLPLTIAANESLRDLNGVGLPEGGNADDIDLAASWSSNASVTATTESITDHNSDTIDAISFNRLGTLTSLSSFYFREDLGPVGRSTTVEFWIAPDGNATRIHVALRATSTNEVESVEVLSGSATGSIVSGGIAEFNGVNTGFNRIRITSSNPDVRRLNIYPYDSSSGESTRNNVCYGFEVFHGGWSPVKTAFLPKPEVLSANIDGGAGSTISPLASVVEVNAVANTSSDWVTLPPLADVVSGTTIRVLCNAASDFNVRTPASSAEEINGVNCDGTNEYSATDTDLIVLTKVSTSQGWVAQSYTATGTLRT